MLCLRQFGLLDHSNELDFLGCDMLERFPSWSVKENMSLGTESTGQGVGLCHDSERLVCFRTILPVDKDIVRGTFATAFGRIKRPLVIADGFERPCCRVGPMEFLVVLILDDVAELIVRDDLIKHPIRHFDQEFNMLVIGSVVIFNLAGNRSAELTTIRHVANESEAKEFIRTEVGAI
jgi:hypothetical protein